MSTRGPQAHRAGRIPGGKQALPVGALQGLPQLAEEFMRVSLQQSWHSRVGSMQTLSTTMYDQTAHA